ncbi:hypothetical protein ACFFGX_21890, partial [Azorhizophilus paspali]
MLGDALWSKLENVLLQQAIYHKPDLGMTVEGMLYRMKHYRAVSFRYDKLKRNYEGMVARAFLPYPDSYPAASKECLQSCA